MHDIFRAISQKEAENAPAFSVEDIVSRGFTSDLYVFLPYCIGTNMENCGLKAERKFYLCKQGDGCYGRMLERDEPCLLGQVAQATEQTLEEYPEVQARGFIVSGSRIKEVYRVLGTARAVVGVACDFELEKGVDSVQKLGSRPFVAPLLEEQKCNESELAISIADYRALVRQAAEYSLACRHQSTVQALTFQRTVL